MRGHQLRVRRVLLVYIRTDIVLTLRSHQLFKMYAFSAPHAYNSPQLTIQFPLNDYIFDPDVQAMNQHKLRWRRKKLSRANLQPKILAVSLPDRNLLELLGADGDQLRLLRTMSRDGGSVAIQTEDQVKASRRGNSHRSHRSRRRHTLHPPPERIH